MLARGAELRRLRPLGDVAAVDAVPLHGRSLREDLAAGHIGDQFPVARLVKPFHLRDLLERLRHLREPLLLRDLSEVGVEGGPLELLPGGCGLEVALRVLDHAGRVGGRDLDVPSLEVLEEDLGMLLLVFRGL